MDYFIPKAMKGRTPAGRPYSFYRGIHTVPDDLANHGDANALGIVPVEEMTDDDWRKLGLDKAKWMPANRPAPETAAEPEPTTSTSDVKAPQAAPTATVASSKAS